MKARPTQSRKGVKGQLPLAGCRDSAPAGVWGNAPTVPRPTNPKEAACKGAGSEASLPVTLRSRRSAPKLLFPKIPQRTKKVVPTMRSDLFLYFFRFFCLLPLLSIRCSTFDFSGKFAVTHACTFSISGTPRK